MLFHLPMKYTNIYHILILSSLLAYIGFFKIKDKTVFIVLALFTLAIIIFVPFPNTSITYWNLVHLSHYFIMLPGLLYLSYLGYYNLIPEQHFYTIGVLAVVIAVYHAFKLYPRIT